MKTEKITCCIGVLGLIGITYCLFDNNWKVSVYYYGMGEDQLHQGLWYRKNFENTRLVLQLLFNS